jgi:hypothetical protein
MTIDTNVQQLLVVGTSSRQAPKRIMRPCEYGLLSTVRAPGQQPCTQESGSDER